MMTMMTTSCSTKTTMMMRTTSVLSTTKSNCRRRFALMSSFLSSSSSPSGKHFHHHQRRNNAKTNEQEEEEVEESRVVIEKEDGPAVLKTKKTKHGVRVFILQRNECDAPSLLEKYERLLSKRELDSIQIESLHPETKKERLQTRAMVRTVLSSILNEGREGRKPSQRKVVDPSSLEFTFNEKGKPFLKQSTTTTTTSSFANSNEEEESTNSFSTSSMSSENLNIQFSVSHSKNVVAMAVTTDGRRVGIDCEVEKRRTKDACLKLAKRYFRKGEAVERIETALAKEEDWGRRVFVRYWCLCESYVKALGVGISGRPFRNFDIAVTEKRNDDDEREDISLFESDPETFGRWRFQLFRETPTIKVKEDERSIVAVCVEDDDEDEDDDTNTNRNITSPSSKRKRRPPIVSSITRVRPLLDDIHDSNDNNEKSSSAIADIEDDDIEILAASS
jgi:phosphopantetheinyl transferase